MGVFSIGTAVLGLAFVFFFGGESRGMVLSDTDSITSNLPATTVPTGTTGTTATPNTTATPSADTEKPSRPSGLRAVVQDGKVMLSWNQSSDNVGVSGYALYRNGNFMVTVPGTSFTDTGVQTGHSYEYEVLAGDYSGNKSDRSSSVTATIPVTGTTTTPNTTTAPTTVTSSTANTPTLSSDHIILSRPGNIAVRILDNRTVRITWSKPTNAVGVVGYRLFKNNTLLASMTGTAYTDASVYGGQEYRYAIVATDSAGSTSERSEEKKVVMPLVTVSTGSTTTNTTWTAENDGDTLIVRNADGQTIQGQSIPPQGNTPSIVMDDVAKKDAAKNALKEAMQTGFIPSDTDPLTTGDLTPDEITRLPVSQYLDFDNDGLSNDDESRLGTDPYSKDTDHDGFSDGDEVSSGHDPKRFSPGDGRDKMKIEDIKSVRSADQVVSSQSVVREETKKDDRYRVKHVEIVKSATPDTPDTKPTVRLSGVAVPNALVTLFIYSTPTIVTVKADSLGNWSYDVKEDLEDGDHEAFVAVTDNTGKITSYGEGIAFVKTAEAITVQPIAEAAETVSENQSPLERSQMEYFFAAFIAILFFSGAALIVVSRKSSGPIVS